MRTYYRPRNYVRWARPIYTPNIAPPAATCQNQFDPSGEWMWVCGRYTWDAWSGWYWSPGRWERIRIGYVYQPGFWGNNGAQWVWTPGTWVADGGY